MNNPIHYNQNHEENVTGITEFTDRSSHIWRILPVAVSFHRHLYNWSMKTMIAPLRPIPPTLAAPRPRIPLSSLICYLQQQHSQWTPLIFVVRRRRIPRTSTVQSKQRSSSDWRTTTSLFPSLTKASRSHTAERVVPAGVIERVWAVDSVLLEGCIRCVPAHRYLVQWDLVTRIGNKNDGLIVIEQCNSPSVLKNMCKSMNICKSERHPLVFFSTEFKGMQFFSDKENVYLSATTDRRWRSLQQPLVSLSVFSSRIAKRSIDGVANARIYFIERKKQIIQCNYTWSDCRRVENERKIERTRDRIGKSMQTVDRKGTSKRWSSRVGLILSVGFVIGADRWRTIFIAYR